MLLYQDYTCLTDVEVLEVAQKEIRSHSIGFVYEELHRGSVNLVQWHDEFGILTAAHVANLFDFGGDASLRIPWCVWVRS